MSEWIPVKEKKLTKKEREQLGYDAFIDFIYVGELPEDGEEVLITAYDGKVYNVLYRESAIYGNYFQEWEATGDVVAWMRYPEPYKQRRGTA